jgi:acetyltransferase-like isoleucine patch superfamily enzyme
MISLLKKIRIKYYKGKGLQIADDCRVMGFPNFGSEPYLISIGNRVTISGKVNFVTHDGGTFVFRDDPKYKDVIKYGRITIHNNCFIGYNTILMPGISVGPNSVVAAGSIVTKDVPPNSVVGGCPAKFIMSLEEYAEKSLIKTPEYNKDAYLYNKKETLLSLFPYPW